MPCGWISGCNRHMPCDYIRRVLERFNMQSTKSASSPLPINLKGIRLAKLCSATIETSDQAQKTGMWWDVSTTPNSKEESALDVNVENPNLGKTTTALRLQKISLYQDYNNGAQRQQPLPLFHYTLNYITTTIIIQPTLHTHTIHSELYHYNNNNPSNSTYTHN